MTTLTTLICAVALAPQQEALYPVPAEFKQASFLVGNWKSEGTGMGMDGGPAKMTGTATGKVTMDRWYELDSKDNMEGFGPMAGKFMLTYNPDKSHWEGIWFDSMMNFSMKTTGTFKEDTFTFMSEEVTMEGQPMTFRITMKKISNTEYQTKVDMKAGDEYLNVLTNNYKKQ